MQFPQASIVVGLVASSLLPISAVSAAGPPNASVERAARAVTVADSFVPGAALPEAAAWIRKGRQALSPTGRDLAEIEIAADHVYFENEGQSRVSDVTRLRGSTLWQARDLAEGHLERFWGPRDAWVETSAGRQELDGPLRSQLRDYHCLRRLQLLSICDGLAAEVETGIAGSRQWLRFEKDGSLFARLGLDRETGLPLLVQHPESAPAGSEPVGVSTATASAEQAKNELVTTVFAAYRGVDGWMVPHFVQSFRGDEPSSIYKVTGAKVEYATEPTFAP